MDNRNRFHSFNTTSNSHVNLNTNMPMPPVPKRSNPQLQQRRFVSGTFNRVPPPPTLNNNR